MEVQSTDDKAPSGGEFSSHRLMQAEILSFDDSDTSSFYSECIPTPAQSRPSSRGALTFESQFQRRPLPPLTSDEGAADEGHSDSEAEAQSPLRIARLRQLKSQPSLKVDADLDFEQMVIVEWIASMLDMRLPLLGREAIDLVLRTDHVDTALQGFISGHGPWRRHLVFFFGQTATEHTTNSSGNPPTKGKQLWAKVNQELVPRANAGVGFKGLLSDVVDARLVLANPHRDTLAKDDQCIYFQRCSNGDRLSRTTFLEHVSCGTFHGGTAGFDAIATWLSELFLPLLMSPGMEVIWGKCQEDEQKGLAVPLAQTMQELADKFETAAAHVRGSVAVAEPDRKLLKIGV